MSASSNRELDLLGKVSIKQIQILLNTVSETAMREVSYVQRIFLESAQNFEETSRFTCDIGWLDEKSGKYDLTEAGIVAVRTIGNDLEFRALLLNSLATVTNPYRRHIATYLCCFHLTEAGLAYRSSIADRVRQGPVRDLLMDLRAISYRPADDSHLVEPHATDLFLWAKNFRSISQDSFGSDIRRKAELGFKAEVVVLEYEKQRVGGEWAYRVEHISCENPFACFDIKSVTVQRDCADARYIEVKAVSAPSFQFHWTRNELDAAQLLRSKYFLYLVPVTSSGRFDTTQMLIIDDPYQAVYQNQEDWNIQNDVVICSRKN